MNGFAHGRFTRRSVPQSPQEASQKEAANTANTGRQATGPGFLKFTCLRR
jgi:hypothetical protein